jgi:hypothetical protein
VEGENKEEKSTMQEDPKILADSRTDDVKVGDNHDTGQYSEQVDEDAGGEEDDSSDDDEIFISKAILETVSVPEDDDSEADSEALVSSDNQGGTILLRRTTTHYTSLEHERISLCKFRNFHLSYL